LYALEPVESVWPSISTVMLGWLTMPVATSLSVSRDGGVRRSESNSKFTPRRITDCSMMQPFASTLNPRGVFGHLSRQSLTPSWSESCAHGSGGGGGGGGTTSSLTTATITGGSSAPKE